MIPRSAALPSFSKALLKWWNLHGRSFPWRKTHDPFRIYLAEILLHRTRAEKVAEIYSILVTRFPTVEDLALSTEPELQNILAPLGLRWRTSLLLKSSRIIVEKYRGEFPLERDSLLELPGVGDYITSALRTFAFGQNDPIIDTNTVRIISRIRNSKQSDSTRRGSLVRKIYSELRNESEPRDFAFAMLDLANKVCLAKNPLCEQCPVAYYCKTGKLFMYKAIISPL
ncbi:MAG: DNA glycosylase [Thermoplasmatales archaeon]